MNISGIVVEYNPFHKGHLYHLNKTKEVTSCDAVIAVMSGNFVQRGIPSFIDKWTKAKMALLNGVDLVLELPLLYSLSSAEFFGYGAITLLNNIGVVNNICFGSESGDINEIMNISKILYEEPEEFKTSLKLHLNEGLTYPLARSQALKEYLINTDNTCLSFNNFLACSNNILAIEYCKNLLKINSKIIPFTIKREGNNYNSVEFGEEFSSATSIRNYIKRNNNYNSIKKYVPNSVFQIIEELKSSNYPFVFEDKLLQYIKYKYFIGENTLENLPDISEGLHNRIYKALEKSNSFEETIENIKTKRYTYTRISRILCQYFLGFDSLDTYNLRKTPCPYARILGFNKKGSQILKEMKCKSTIPIYTKIPKEINPTLSLDIRGTKCYNLLNNFIDPLADYKNRPIIL
ncbi:nucleotidyltransferase [Clostridium lundense]|uniref:nucleotidyltransferase n=1 Tax=Clostridium lundense TaxID=319475 RepID=UPI0004849FB8|nr:nucleotidyltransferase [Clostridium lundense]